MFFILDNTEDEKFLFYYFVNNKLVQRNYKVVKNKSIAAYLEKLLVDLKLNLIDVTCLGVVVGEGKFTASRLAVTAVNTLAYSLKIPAVALPKNFDEALALKLAKSAVVGEYLIPTYSAEARVS